MQSKLDFRLLIKNSLLYEELIMERFNDIKHMQAFFWAWYCTDCARVVGNLFGCLCHFCHGYFFAWLLIFAGFIQFGHASMLGMEWILLTTCRRHFCFIAGILILFRPVAGAATLTLLLSFCLSLKVHCASLWHYQKKLAYWGWVLVSGILPLRWVL